MSDVTLIGLGFQGNANNRFQSVNNNQAPGSAAFYACVLVNIQESLLSAPVEASYFGNFVANVGWDIGRDADTPASDPPNTPEIITLRARFGHGGITTTLTYSTDAAPMFGRTHLIEISLIGLVATLYINGAAVAQGTLADALTLGNSGLTYGNVAGGGLRSGDPVISAAYSDTDAADFITNQRALFDGIRTSGKLAGTITTLGLSAGYIYESFQQKSPIAGVPTTPLKNFGTVGANGNLIFQGSTALVINADPDPDYTGGAQSASGSPPSGNLQDAYDAGPTGLIETDAPGPFGVDSLRLENASLFTEESSDPIPTLTIAGGDQTGTDPGGSIEVSSGDSLENVGGSILVTGGLGGTLDQEGQFGQDGGSITIVSGMGGEGANSAGNGGELNIEAGSAAASILGGPAGVGGALSLSAGTGLDGTGGEVTLSSGNGDTGSGNLRIFVGTSSGAIGLLSIIGGAANGIGSADGGDVEVLGGDSAVGEGQRGGDVDIQGGLGETPNPGGAVNITGGLSTNGPGGEVNVFGGDGGGGVLNNSGTGGNVTVAGGAASQPDNQGGNIIVTGGAATGTGSAPGGFVSIDGGASTNDVGGSIIFRTGVGPTEADCGSFQIGLGSSGLASSPVGGFHINPADNLLTLRTQDFAGTETGSMLLHRLNTAGEVLQAATNGLVHFRTEQAAGDDVTVGFRAAKSGNYGLMGRVYSRAFDAADAPGDTLTVTHNLDCVGLVVGVYDPAGNKVFENPTGLAGVVAMSSDVLELTFAGGFITAGTWRVTVFGY